MLEQPRPRRRRLIVGVAVATALLVAPATVWASHTFVDVPDASVFHDDIAWLFEADVTRGCNPPDNDEFCPNDPVTREQMAAFMRRLATNRVVDADTVDGSDASDFVAAGAADAVTPVMTSAEAGIAQSIRADQLALDGTFQSVESVTVDAPAAGFVFVTGTAEALFVHTNGQSDWVEIGVTPGGAAGFADDEAHGEFLTSGILTGIYPRVLSVSKAFPVAQGSTTFHLSADLRLGDVRIHNVQLTALYVPTAYGEVEVSATP